MEYVFASNALKKRYGKYTALSGLTMNVPKGSIYGLIGRNGAGKTTAIRIICGLQEPSEGEYTLYGVGSGDRMIVAYDLVIVVLTAFGTVAILKKRDLN